MVFFDYDLCPFSFSVEGLDRKVEAFDPTVEVTDARVEGFDCKTMVIELIIKMTAYLFS